MFVVVKTYDCNKKKKKWFKFGAKLLRFLCYLLEIISINEKKSAIIWNVFCFSNGIRFFGGTLCKVDFTTQPAVW